MTNRNIEAVYPLSPLQQGILFHSLESHDATRYVGQSGYRLTGRFDVERFVRACQQVVARHTVLRTAVVWEGVESPLQVVGRSVELPIERLDWRALPVHERADALDALARRHRDAGFDLLRAPLMRIAVARLGDEEHEVLWTHHHLIMDGASLSIVVGDVLQVYEELARGGRPTLAALPSFATYIEWLARRDRDDEERFWRRSLAGVSATTPLIGGGTAGAATSVGDDTHGVASLQIAGDAADGLHAFARRHQVTLHTMVAGAWAIVLSRACGRSQVLFGETVAGRPAGIAGIESMVGLFINTIPVCIRVPEETSVAEWLRTIQREHADRREHTYTPLSSIRRWSEIPAGEPLFHHLLIFNQRTKSAERAGAAETMGVTATTARETTNYPVVLRVTAAATISMHLVYDVRVIDRDLAERTLQHIGRLLEAFATTPLAPLRTLSLISAAEREQVLRVRNDTTTLVPRPDSVFARFTRAAADRPDAVALIASGQRYAYGDIGSQVNRWAHYLRRSGVGPEVSVGVALDRIPDLLHLLLAISAVGGAYVPLDPTLPPNRLAYMADDAGLRFIIASAADRDRLASAAPVVDLASALSAVAAEPDTPVVADAAGDALAYVLYTSGSTGRPKGVQVSHRALLNFLHSMRTQLGIRADDRLLAVTTLSFDIAALELYLPLLVGGTVVLASREDVRDGARLADLITTCDVTMMQGTPATWRLLLESSWAGRERFTALCGGESLPTGLARRLRARVARLWNMYGPTETTVWSTMHAVDDLTGVVVPIGKPIANTRVYVLDRRLDPAPIGALGELYIAGDGLARGYAGRPDLTVDRFVPDPWSMAAGERMYRTGDLARWRPDGTLEYGGRIDHQVKVRGFRIETGEIESVLLAQAGVTGAIVVPRQAADGDATLVAYVAGDVPGGPNQLRDALAQALPAYMVPARCLVMPALPLTPNGKVDRAALPAPGDLDAPHAPGSLTPMEELVAGVWSDVLGVEVVSPQADFFSLGGHSLAAMRIVSRIRHQLGVDVRLGAMLATPSLAAFATAVEAARAAALPLPTPIVVRADRDEYTPSFAQQRLWLVERLHPGGSAYNLSVAFRITGAFVLDAFAGALADVAARHDVLRTSFHAVDGEPVARVTAAGVDVLPVVDLTRIPAGERDAQARRIAQSEARRPFDLTRAPLFRAVVLRLAPREHVVLVTIHHIVFDGASFDIFMREVASCYGARARGVSPTLPNLSLRYGDYAAWQREWLRGEVLDEHLAYWRRQLAGAPRTSLAAPTRSRGEERNAARHLFVVPAALSDAVRALSRRQAVTVFMTTLAALQTLLHRHSGQDDVVVGTNMASRPERGTEALIGLFVNQLVLRCDLSGNPTFAQVLARVRATVLGAFAHQQVPFDLVVQALQPHREVGRNPLFDVMFLFQHGPRPLAVAPSPVQMTPFALDRDSAAFDVTVAVTDSGAGGFAGAIDYRPRVVAADVVERLVADFGSVLDAAVQNLDTRVGELPLAGVEDRLARHRRERQQALAALAAAVAPSGAGAAGC